MVWDHIFRTLFVYFLVLVVIRMMGKREVGQLSPFDFVVAIIIADLAAIPMEATDVPLWHSILPLVFLALLEIIMSYATLFSQGVRAVVCGQPQMVIKNGRLQRHEMRRARYNLDDLLAQLREKGIVNVADVEFAILENSGRLSVIHKSQHRTVTPADLGINTGYEGLPTVLVMDGNVMTKNLREVLLDEKWLYDRLEEHDLVPKKVILASLGTDGKLFINTKTER